MQLLASTLALASLAAALPADLTARSFTGGRCRVEVSCSASSLSGSWDDLSVTFYDGAGKKTTSGSAQTSGNEAVAYVQPFKLTQGSGGLPHDLTVTPYIPAGQSAPLMAQPLATLVYAGFTFDGNNAVCQMHAKNNIATGMTCGFAC